MVSFCYCTVKCYKNNTKDDYLTLEALKHFQANLVGQFIKMHYKWKLMVVYNDVPTSLLNKVQA